MKLKLPNCECERNAPMTPWERVCSGFALLSFALGLFVVGSCVGGCMSDKASHQNGVVLYVSSSGQVGVGYGETEDLPGGCKYYREVTQISPAFWGDGTNYTRTVTRWDTTAMMTNGCGRAEKN